MQYSTQCASFGTIDEQQGLDHRYGPGKESNDMVCIIPVTLLDPPPTNRSLLLVLPRMKLTISLRGVNPIVFAVRKTLQR